jgi:hypothetical protein
MSHSRDGSPHEIVTGKQAIHIFLWQRFYQILVWYYFESPPAGWNLY